MFNKSRRYFAAMLCAFIFLVKMSISISPIFTSSLDQNTILQIVLQLEIENSSAEDNHEKGIKFFDSKSEESFCYATAYTENNAKQKHYLKNEKSIKAFHPAVPTPPPNC